MQDPLFCGESGAIAYLPSRQVAIAVAVTYEPAAYTSPASPKNSADFLWPKIAATLAPADAPMIPPMTSAMPEERLAVVRRARTSTGMSCPPGRSSGDQDRGVPGRPAGPAETVVWARQARWTGAGGRPAHQRG